ncbi:MAG TPA: SDR family oxidoreductase [Gammaproteobacteria bacterium]|nr:SDR family oxidoreductase [Gammaproteobacteria bacterium]
MTRKTVLITGATSGLGLATAHELARRDYRVIVGGRTEYRCDKAVAAIRAASGNDDIDAVACPLSSRDHVNHAADIVLGKCDRLDVLINNAATLLPTRRTTLDGLEATFMVNYLAPFMLTQRLLERMQASVPARILNIASRMHQYVDGINFDDLQSLQNYDAFYGAFTQSKLALIMFSYELARRLEGSGVTVNCIDPGLFRTSLSQSRAAPFYLKLLRPLLLSTPEHAAETVVAAVDSADYAQVTGACIAREGVIETSDASRDREAQARLWDVSLDLAEMAKPG